MLAGRDIKSEIIFAICSQNSFCRMLITGLQSPVTNGRGAPGWSLASTSSSQEPAVFSFFKGASGVFNSIPRCGLDNYAVVYDLTKSRNLLMPVKRPSEFPSSGFPACSIKIADNEFSFLSCANGIYFGGPVPQRPWSGSFLSPNARTGKPTIFPLQDFFN